MNKIGKAFGTALTIAAAFGLSACAATPSGNTVAQAETQQMSNVQRYRQAVERNAERNNVRVEWVNPPKEEDLDEYDE